MRLKQCYYHSGKYYAQCSPNKKSTADLCLSKWPDLTAKIRYTGSLDQLPCGNGSIDSEIGESCEGSNLGGETCLNLGYTGGTLACDDFCQFDAAGCTNYICPNDIQEPGEDCDGIDLNSYTCSDLENFNSGILACNPDCTFDTTLCSTLNMPVHPADTDVDAKISMNEYLAYAGPRDPNDPIVISAANIYQMGPNSGEYTYSPAISGWLPRNPADTDTDAKISMNEYLTYAGPRDPNDPIVLSAQNINQRGANNGGYIYSTAVACWLPLTSTNDPCTSLGYECGQHTVCSSLLNCGTCSSGTCSLGTCIALPDVSGIINSAKGYWTFEGDAVDDIAGFSPTVYGATLTQDKNNNPNSAYLFDGVNDRIGNMDRPYHYYGSQPYSVAALVKVNNPTSGNDKVIVSNHDQGRHGDYKLEIHTDGKAYFGWMSNNVDQWATSTTTLSSDNWYYIVGTWDGTNSKLYINGVNENTTDYSNSKPEPTHNSFTIGDHDAWNYAVWYGPISPFDGIIDEVGIWDRALTQQEITDLATYHSVRQEYSPPQNPTYNIEPDCSTITLSDSDNDNYLEISNCHELQCMKNDMTASYEITQNIDCSGTKYWNNGAGFDPVERIGKLKGNYHTIQGLSINRPNEDNVGLISRHLGGPTNSKVEIESLGLVNVNITARASVGSFFGNGKLSIKESYSTGSVNGARWVGGIAGYLSDALVENSYSHSSVYASENRGGGIVGHFSLSTLKNLYSTGLITGGDYINGLAGTRGQNVICNNNFFDSENSGHANAAYHNCATPKTTTEMQQQSTFTSAGWSTSIWNFQQNQYPSLNNFGSQSSSSSQPNSIDPTTTQGLVSYWPFDSNANDVISQNHGTPNSITWTTGKVNNAANFDTTSDSIHLGNNKFEYPEFTVAMWVSIPPMAMPTLIFSNYGIHPTYNSAYQGYQLMFDPMHDYLRFVTRWASQITLSSDFVPNNNWRYLVAVVEERNDNFYSDLYIDGVLSASTLIGRNGLPSNANVQAVLGYRPDNHVLGGFNRAFFKGKIDELMIWNRGLSSTEISQIYNHFNQEIYTCTDTDSSSIKPNGNAPYTLGTATSTDGTSITDTCLSAAQVNEAICRNGLVEINVSQCYYGYICENGRCIEDNCVDTDVTQQIPSGDNPSQRGTTTTPTNSVTDYCYPGSIPPGSITNQDCSGANCYLYETTCNVGNLNIGKNPCSDCRDGVCYQT